MIASLVVVFREVFEIGIVVTTLLAATRGIAYRTLWVGYGILAGVFGAGVLAFFAGSIASAMAGMGQEVFNACILLIAVAMLIWHNMWMARCCREMMSGLRTMGGDVAVGKKPLAALAVVVGVAVLREGSEVVLFLYGIAVSGNDPVTMVAGGLSGLALGVGISALMYFGLVHIPTRHLFKVTGTLIALLAAGMAAQAGSFLQQAQVITAFSEVLWDTSGLVADHSLMGKVLHAVMGYVSQPTSLQVIIYMGILLLIFGSDTAIRRSIEKKAACPKTC